MLGRVIYSSGGNYKALTDKGVFNCKPLGIFRNDNIKIIVGDFVEIEINENKEGLEEINVITELKERKNEFVRPNISNIDYSILVTSINEPSLNDFYLDKLISIFQSNNIEPIIIFTKKDLGINEEQEQIINEYKEAGYKLLVTGKEITQEEKDKLHSWIKNKFTVITGQTGVGKSTLLNSLNDNLDLETGEISKSLGRGKHTTRHSEAFEIFENAFIVDTPGFSSLELTGIKKELLSWKFFKFEQYAKDCKFNDCSHTSEKECSVKEKFSSRTMKNYEKLLEEIK